MYWSDKKDRDREQLLKTMGAHVANIEREVINQNIKLQGIFQELVAQLVILNKILAGQGQKPGPLKTLTFHLGTPAQK